MGPRGVDAMRTGGHVDGADRAPATRTQDRSAGALTREQMAAILAPTVVRYLTADASELGLLS